MRIVVVGGIRLSCEGLTHFLRRSQASPAPSPLADESPYHGARRVQPILPDVSGSRDGIHVIAPCARSTNHTSSRAAAWT
jgi:hypothetical protein